MNKTITISEDDLMEAEANVLTEMVLKTPKIALISGVLTTFSALVVEKLFNEKEDK